MDITWNELIENEDGMSLVYAEKGMQALDTALDPDGLDAQGQEAWNSYEAGVMARGVCPCGVEGCKGLDWILDGEEAF